MLWLTHLLSILKITVFSSFKICEKLFVQWINASCLNFEKSTCTWVFYWIWENTNSFVILPFIQFYSNIFVHLCENVWLTGSKSFMDLTAWIKSLHHRSTQISSTRQDLSWQILHMKKLMRIHINKICASLPSTGGNKH